jgi:hypothetical protein
VLLQSPSLVRDQTRQGRSGGGLLVAGFRVQREWKIQVSQRMDLAQLRYWELTHLV